MADFHAREVASGRARSGWWGASLDVAWTGMGLRLEAGADGILNGGGSMWWSDVKYGFRMLVKNPLFSGVAILTLALGIGANAAIYTVVEAVLLEPLAFEDGDELVLLWTRNDELGQDKYMVSPMDFDDWRTTNNTFASMAAFWPTTGTVTEDDGNPTRVNVVYTTEDFFDVMGARPLHGRAFGPDDGPGSPQIVVLAEGFWERRFGGDPSIVGQRITLDGNPLDVVGVVSGPQTFPDNADLWTNMTWTMQIQGRNSRWMSAVGRLSPGTPLETASADMVTVAARIEEANPESNRGWTTSIDYLQEEMVGDTKAALVILLGATGLILLIACATVANLLLSRAEVRSTEMAVRVAFGAPRSRLVRQLLVESSMLAAAGALAGLIIAQLGVRGLLQLAPVTLPREETIALDGTVLLVVVAVSLSTGLLFGLAPIWQLLRKDLHTAIRRGGRGSAGRGAGLQHTFVIAQFALALVLAVGAGLLVRSFQNIRSIDSGFVASGVLTAELDLSPAVAPEDTDVTDFYEQYARRLSELPGVESVGDATTLPLSENLDYFQNFRILDREFPPELETRAYFRMVQPGFLDAMRTPVVAGRDFDERDRNGAPGVALVNETFARRFFPEGSPIGERLGDLRGRYGPLGALHLAGDIQESEIVGIVKDVRYDGLRVDPVPSIYLSGLQSSLRRRTIVVRTVADPSVLVPAMRRTLAEMNAGVALTRVQTMNDVLADAQSRDRFSTLLLGMFGLVALLLAAVGVYGVLAYTVEQRTGEVGIRIALGADRSAVRGMILKDGLRLVGVGLGAGLIVAFFLSSTLATQLYGVDPREPVVYLGVVIVLVVVGVAASFIPALRATRIDPLTAMRAE